MLRKLPFLILVVVFSCSQQSVFAQKQQSIELGQVEWLRDYDQALKQAEESQKPVFILFQEVPGCATCRNYGQNVLSNPLIVEAIENCFVPLAIHNNKGGKDREILDLYREPSWNNPVVRMVDAQGVDLIDRVSGNYTAPGLTTAMIKALEKANKSVPTYLDLLNQELQAKTSGNIQQQHYKMYCFWSGEGHLGQAEGVIATKPGFMNGYEVVEVLYDASKISEKALDHHAKSGNCSPLTNKANFRPDIDPQYYLKHSNFRYLPLTPLQRTKINSALGHKKSGTAYLSPQQLAWYQDLSQNSAKQSLYEKPFQAAYATARKNY